MARPEVCPVNRGGVQPPIGIVHFNYLFFLGAPKSHRCVIQPFVWCRGPLCARVKRNERTSKPAVNLRGPQSADEVARTRFGCVKTTSRPSFSPFFSSRSRVPPRGYRFVTDTTETLAAKRLGLIFSANLPHVSLLPYAFQFLKSLQRVLQTSRLELLLRHLSAKLQCF